MANKQNAEAGFAAAPGSANWEYQGSEGVNMWTWNPERGTRYMVTQLADNIQAHLTTGTAHKFTRTIGSYATVTEAWQRCMEHWPNARTEPPAK